jgi:predicted O-methyltransferase YrrM
VLCRLHGERFDFIYIDGAHEAKYAIQDAVLGWALLPAGGFMLFDDTHFSFPDHPEQNTQTAMAAFRSWFADEMDVLTPLLDRQMLVRKRG